MINLSNYEEYFLLYIDNELSKEQCKAVEIFVLQHPHLATELDILQEAKLPPEETVVFSDKSTLYKAAGDSININNYEECFLLHTDKELSAIQEEEVAQFVLQHPLLQEEFLLLQSLKLAAENLECPDKHLLYKQPAKRVIPLYMARISIAAAIAGVVALTGNFLINNIDDSHKQVAITKQQSEPVEKSALSQKELIPVSPEKKESDSNVVKIVTKPAGIAVVKSTKANKSLIKTASLNNKNKSNNEQVVVKINPLSQTQQTPPAPEDEMVNNNLSSKHEHAIALKLLEEVNEKESASTERYVSNEYATAKPVVYKELNTDEDDQTLFVSSLQLNKAKVNGLLKKATHLLGSKAKESNL